MKGDPFNLENLRLPPDVVERRVEPRKIRERRQHFVKVPWSWIEQLAKARHISTYRVALHVLYQHWKRQGQSFPLANGALAMEGVDRYRKRDALQELEQLGLVRVERRVRKSPLIVVIL